MTSYPTTTEVRRLLRLLKLEHLSPEQAQDVVLLIDRLDPSVAFCTMMRDAAVSHHQGVATAAARWLRRSKVWPCRPLLAFARLQRHKKGNLWLISECPLCGEEHTHGAGPLDGNPQNYLGHRSAHCYQPPINAEHGYLLVRDDQDGGAA